jgi:hypothetical protein
MLEYPSSDAAIKDLFGDEGYPGQAFYHAHNPRIKRAEENWQKQHPN